MKTILFILAVIILTSCGGGDPTYNDEKDLMRLEKPVIVVAVHHRDEFSYGSVIVKGSDGEYVTFTGNSYTGHALMDSYEKGDTISNLFKI